MVEVVSFLRGVNPVSTSLGSGSVYPVLGLCLRKNVGLVPGRDKDYELCLVLKTKMLAGQRKSLLILRTKKENYHSSLPQRKGKRKQPHFQNLPIITKRIEADELTNNSQRTNNAVCVRLWLEWRLLSRHQSVSNHLQVAGVVTMHKKATLLLAMIDQATLCLSILRMHWMFFSQPLSLSQFALLSTPNASSAPSLQRNVTMPPPPHTFPRKE